MRKIYLLIITCFSVINVYSQNPLKYNEDEGVYELKIIVEKIYGNVSNNDNNNSHGNCTNKFGLDLHLSGGSGWTGWSEGQGDFWSEDLNFGWQYSKTTEISTTLFLDEIRFYGERSWADQFGNNCTGLSGYKVTDIYDYGHCYSETHSGIIPNWNSTVKIDIRPKTFNLYYFDPNGQERSTGTLFLTDTRPISIKPTKGFSSAGFRWQYKIGAGSWQNWTSMDNQPELNIIGFDIPNVDYIEDIVKKKELIDIRLSYGCGHYSDHISLTPVIYAPSIESVTPVLETCHGDDDGKFIIRFDRVLYPEEYMEVSAEREGGISYTATVLQNSYSVTRDSLPPGSYTIQLVGVFSDDSSYYATYTGGNNQSVQRQLAGRSPITINSIDSLPINCYGGSDGKVQLNISGGTKSYYAKYTYNGSTTDSTAWFGENVQQSIENLPAGIYDISIRDGGGCSPLIGYLPDIRTVTITQPSAPVQFGSIDTLSPSGYKLTNGYITLNPVTGGTGGHTYEWTKDGVPFTPLPSVTDAQNLGMGLYRITVKDSQYASASPATEANCRGCYDTISFFLNQPDSLEVQISIVDSINCYNGYGELAATVSGGVLPYTSYDWEKWNGSTWLPESSYSTLDNALAGKYRVRVTDSKNNQTLSPEFTLSQPDLLTITGFNTLNPLCYGNSDGWAEPIVIGGTVPYLYQWLENVVNPDTIRLTNLPDGYYNIKVTDRKGCTITGNVTLTQPDTLTIAETITLPSAYDASDGAIQLNVTGGTPMYTYLWAHDNSTSNPLTGISTNDNPYIVTVTDAHGCFKVASPRVIFPLEVHIAIIDSILCSGDTNGKLQTWAHGGVGTNYQYEWYKVENGTPQSLGVYSSILTNVEAGTYQVKATDMENFEVSALFVFNSPDSLKVSLTQYNLLCKHDADAWIEAHPTGGTLPYTYQWSNSGTTKKIENLIEGDYNVIMADSRGCFVNASTAITAPDELLLQIHYVEPLAHDYSDASAWVSVTGGTTPYFYTWQGRTETVDSISGIPHGTYTAIVTDANGCQKQISVTVPNPPLLEAFVSESRVISCNGRGDGQLTATSQGGVGNKHYTWYKRENNMLQQLSTGGILDNVPTGEYVVKVTDDNGIEAYSTDFTLVHPDVIQIGITANSIACNGDTDGWVKASVTGGTLPYNYQWTSGHTTSEVLGLTDDKYFVFVTDARGCEIKGQGEISVPGGLLVDTVIKHPTCHNSTNGSISIQVSGGVAPYSYLWSNGSTGTSINNLSSGNYSVKVTGTNGCFKVVNITLENPEPVIINLGPNRTLCINQQIELDASINNGVLYQWLKDGQYFASTAKVLVGDAGIYSVTATNAAGCVGQSNILIEKNNSVIVANFGAPYKVARGVVTQLANVNYPSPEKIEWLIPNDPNILIASMNDEYVDVIFYQNGIYTLGMRSIQGECEQVLYKSIEVVDSYEIPTEIEEQGEHLKEFIVYPNPSNGQFTAKIELGEPTDIRLRLYDIFGGIVDERTLAGQSSYEIHYNINNGMHGVYVLQLIAKKVNTSVKLLFAQ